MRRGRKPALGTIYYLGRLRFRPGLDPPELEALLMAITQAEPGQRADILRAALLSGAKHAQATAATIEDSRTKERLDNMFIDF